MMTTQTHKTLAHSLWNKDQELVQNVVMVVLGSLAIWVSAKIQVPFYPVPITMQTFAILVIGMVFGKKLGAATVALYLAEGMTGLPVFAGTPEKGIGLSYMIGPTGGYLLGYLLAATAVGYLAERGFDRNVFTTAIAMIVGNALIYVPGLLWLGFVVGWDKPVLQWGMTPFLYGDAAKLLLAASLMPLLWRIGNSR